MVCLQMMNWSTHIDELGDRESELTDMLTDAGYDIAEFITEYFQVRKKVKLVQQDPAEMAFRSTVDKVLDSKNPVKIASATGNVTTVVPIGASGFSGASAEAEELAEVDVLEDGANVDERGEVLSIGNADLQNVFDDDEDARGKEAPISIINTGAKWVAGCRISGSVFAVLHDYQVRAVEFAVKSLTKGDDGTGVLFAHAMGTGKSLTTLTTLSAFSGLRAIIVCPKGMVQPWADEVARWYAIISLDAHTMTDTDDHLERNMKLWLKYGGLFIIGHDQFRRCTSRIPIDKNTVLVIDEAHLLKNSTTKLYQAVSTADTHRRILLSGTPLQNNLIEYFTMTQLIRPGLLGNTEREFKQKYANAIDAGMHKDSTTAQQNIAERTVMVLRQFASETVHDVSVDVLKKCLPTKYEFRLLHASAEVEVDASLIKQRHNVHEAARHSKVTLVAQMIDQIRINQPTSSIVVFSTRNDTLVAFKATRDGELLVGGMGFDQREKILENFRAANGNVLYVATKAGGVGINLSHANFVIVADVSWNPCDDEQAVSRCFRIGQTRETFVYRLVASGTFEEGIYRLGVQKHNLAARILEDMSVDAIYTKDELANLTDTDTKGNVDYLSADDVRKIDNVLWSIMLCAQFSGTGTIDVSDHTKLLGQTNATPTFAEENDAQNAINQIKYSKDRMLFTSDGTMQPVDTKQVNFALPYETEVVKALTPYFLEADGISPKTTFKASETIKIMLGPSLGHCTPFNTAPFNYIELVYRIVDDDTEGGEAAEDDDEEQSEEDEEDEEQEDEEDEGEKNEGEDEDEEGEEDEEEEGEEQGEKNEKNDDKEGKEDEDLYDWQEAILKTFVVHQSGLKILPFEHKGKFRFKARLIQKNSDRDPVVGNWSDESACLIIR